MWLGHVETIGRIILWLAIASACVRVPVEYIRQHRVEVEQMETARRAEEEAKKVVKAAHEPHRLSLASIGMFIQGLSTSGAVGRLWFTNVSRQKGFLCVYAVATNGSTKRKAQSLPACLEVAAYASTLPVEVKFAGGELGQVCPKQTDCAITFNDAAEKTE